MIRLAVSSAFIAVALGCVPVDQGCDSDEDCRGGRDCVVGECRGDVEDDDEPRSDGVTYPTTILSASLTLISTGDPRVSLSYRNDGSEIVDEMKFECQFYSENTPVEQFGSGLTGTNLVDDEDLPPGATGSGNFDLFGWDGSNKVVIEHGNTLLDNGDKLRCDGDDDCPRLVICLASESSCRDPED